MIQLHPDYLLVETRPGQIIPCAAELVAVELIGGGAVGIDPELVQQAAAAVLHYFRHDLGWTTVSVGEFAKALEQALQSLGVPPSGPEGAAPVRSFDLRQLCAITDKAFELSFFPMLREAVRTRLGDSTQQLRFFGLRSCVKKLTGAKRWSKSCQTLNDQIVDYLRSCLAMESKAGSCALVVH